MRRLLLLWLLVLFGAGCDRGEYVLNKGNQAFHRGQWAEARNYYQQALAIPRSRDTALYNLSRVARAEGDVPGALDYLSQFLRVVPEDRSARLDRAQILFESGDPAGAAADWGPLSEQGSGEATLGLARIQLARGKRGEAARLFEQALSDPASAMEARRFLAGLTSEEGESLP